jgi:hypothetical protein|tara:strand:+ start:232 stop:381 length:150 start_codon:yes stop_codon:yes gene_type:complete
METKKYFITSNNTEKNNQFSTGSIYVREDDQDWGSAGMNDVQKEADTNQ